MKGLVFVFGAVDNGHEQDRQFAIALGNAPFEQGGAHFHLPGEKLRVLHHRAHVIGDLVRCYRLCPGPGAHGSTVIFLHPKDFLGTLIELVQENPGAAH